jgi:hypothetical protein
MTVRRNVRWNTVVLWALLEGCGDVPSAVDSGPAVTDAGARADAGREDRDDAGRVERDAGEPADTPLARWLASQPIGVWTRYEGSSGFETALFESNAAGKTRDAMGYSSVAAFDPESGEIAFTGKGYGGGTEYVSVVWDLANDAWSERARGSARAIFEDAGPEEFGHAYNGNAFIPSIGYCFYAFQNPAVQCWDRGADAFRTRFVVPGDDAYAHATPVLLPFPERGPAGSVFFHAKSNGTYLLDLSSGSSADLGSPSSDPLHSIGGHNPARREILFGGGSEGEDGSSEYWVLSDDGALSERRTWPVRAGVELNDAVLYDPVRGDWLLASTQTRTLHRSADGLAWTPAGELPTRAPVVYVTLPAPYAAVVAIASGFAEQNERALWILRF